MKSASVILVLFVVGAVLAGPRPLKGEFICMEKPHSVDEEYFANICDVTAYSGFVLSPEEGVFSKLTPAGEMTIILKQHIDRDSMAPLQNTVIPVKDGQVVTKMKNLNSKLRKFALLYVTNTESGAEEVNPVKLEAFIALMKTENIQGVIVIPYLASSLADSTRLLPQLTLAFKQQEFDVYFSAPAIVESDLTKEAVDKLKLCDKIIMKTTKLSHPNRVSYDAPLAGKQTHTIEQTLQAYMGKGIPADKLVGALSLDGVKYYTRKGKLGDEADSDYASFINYCDLFTDPLYQWKTDEQSQSFYGVELDEWITFETPDTLAVKTKALSKATGGIVLYDLHIENDDWTERCHVNRHELVNAVVNNFGKVTKS